MSERDPRCAGSDGGHGGLVSRSRTGQDCLAVSVSPWSGEQKEGLGGEYEAEDRSLVLNVDMRLLLMEVEFR